MSNCPRREARLPLLKPIRFEQDSPAEWEDPMRDLVVPGEFANFPDTYTEASSDIFGREKGAIAIRLFSGVHG